MNTKTKDYIEPLRSQVSSRLRDMQDCVTDKAKNASYATDQYVRENPWRIIAVVAVAACITGWFLNSTRD